MANRIGTGRIRVLSGLALSCAAVLLVWGSQSETHHLPSEKRPESTVQRPLELAGGGSRAPRLPDQAGQEVLSAQVRPLSVPVMSLRTFLPLPNFEVRSADPLVAEATDSRGELRTTRQRVTELCRDGGARWYFLRKHAVPGSYPLSLWTAPRLRVRIKCLTADGLALPAGARVDCTIVRPFASGLPGQSEIDEVDASNLDRVRLSELGLARSTFELEADQDGHVSVDLPHFTSQGVTISHARDVSEYVRIPDVPTNWDETQTVTMSLALTAQGFVVRGVLTDDASRPVRGQRVSLLVGRGVEASQFSLGQELARGEALAVSVTNGGKSAYVKTHRTARTGSDGTFEITSKVTGNAVLAVFREGFLPLRTAVGPERPGGGLVLQLRRPQGRAQALVTLDGRALSRGSLHVSDMTRQPQAWFDVSVDESGRFPAEWFESGIEYRVTYTPADGTSEPQGLRCQVTWNGDSTLEFTSRR